MNRNKWCLLYSVALYTLRYVWLTVVTKVTYAIFDLMRKYVRLNIVQVILITILIRHTRRRESAVKVIATRINYDK